MQYFSLIGLLIALKICNCCTYIKDENITGSNNAADNIGPIIIGGDKAPPNKYPWLVTVSHRVYPSKCAGAIIGETSVLTAAHCLHTGHYEKSGPPTDEDGKITDKKYVTGFVIGAGSTHWDKPQETFKPEEIIVHPQFSKDGKKGSSDLAIIKLSKRITFSESIKEVCLPENRCLEMNSKRANITGWGQIKDEVRTNHLMEGINIPIWKREECAALKKKPLAEHFICAGGRGEATPCSGDSGGPLFVHEFQKDFVIGVVSHGSITCSKKEPVYFISVSFYMEWIWNHSDYEGKQECDFPSGYSC